MTTKQIPTLFQTTPEFLAGFNAGGRPNAHPPEHYTEAQRQEWLRGRAEGDQYATGIFP